MSLHIIRTTFALCLLAGGSAVAQQASDDRLSLAVSGQAFYGPDILTFGSADSLTDLSARTLQEELFFGVGYRFLTMLCEVKSWLR
jgi:hypothetical protein